MTKKLGGGARAYVALLMLFLYLPIFVLIAFSFNESKNYSHFTSFSLKWYAQLFKNEVILSSLGATLLVAAVSSAVATVLGTAAAVGMSGMRRWSRAVITNVTYVPVINPEIVTGISMMLLFVVARNAAGLFEMGMGTLIIAHITFNLPYVIFSVNPKLRQMDKNLYEAALDLGCSHGQAFFKVVLPEIMPGVTTGFLMALTYSIDDFVISHFTAGTVQTLPITIFSMTRKQVSPEINALSTIMFVIVLSILLVMNLKDLRGEKKILKEKLL
jgi:spermidine/putrescine transport system permease protein